MGRPEEQGDQPDRQVDCSVERALSGLVADGCRPGQLIVCRFFGSADVMLYKSGLVVRVEIRIRV